MRVTFSIHAFDRLDYRDVSKAQVERIIKHGSVTRVQEDGLIVKDGEADGRKLRVVYKKVGPKPWSYHVITVIEL